MRALVPSWMLLSPTIAFALGCGDSPVSLQRPVPEATPGFAPFATKIGIPIGAGLERICHGTVVAPLWVLTAAHCLEGASLGARGYLEAYNRGFALRTVELHPNAVALNSSARLAWASDTLSAAFDLALLSLESPLDVQPPRLVGTQEAQSALEQSDGLVRFSHRGPEGSEQTAFAYLTGEVDASTLVGPTQRGALLSGYGVGVLPGNSGAGVWVQPLEDESTEPISSPPVLVGVVQDANPDDPTLPFGVVPLYKAAIDQWLDGVLTPPP